jgi:hypothetical protein
MRANGLTDGPRTPPAATAELWPIRPSSRRAGENFSKFTPETAEYDAPTGFDIALH